MKKTHNNQPHNSHEPSHGYSRKEKALAIGLIASAAIIGVDTADKVMNHYDKGDEVSVSANPLSWVTAPVAKGIITTYDAIHPEAVEKDATHITISEDPGTLEEFQVEVHRGDR